MFPEFQINKTVNGYMVRLRNNPYEKGFVSEFEKDIFTFESLSALLKWIEDNFKTEKKVGI